MIKRTTEITLENSVIRIKRTTTSFSDDSIWNHELSETIEESSHPLAEISVEDLNICRRSEVSSLVIKENGKLYYAEIPRNIHFVSANLFGGRHQCHVAHSVCAHLSALSDKDGGCAKVRDKAVRIEKYPWITTGYETFNTQNDVFVVVECLRYEKSV